MAGQLDKWMAPGQSAAPATAPAAEEREVHHKKHLQQNLQNHGKGHGHIGVVDMSTHQPPKAKVHGNKYQSGPKKNGTFGHARHYEFEN
jgi:hypothetical protein